MSKGLMSQMTQKGHFGDALPSQSHGPVLRTLNKTQDKIVRYLKSHSYFCFQWPQSPKSVLHNFYSM